MLRTPDERFAELPDFPWEPRYADVPDLDGGTLRMAYIDAGDAHAPVVLCIHGEPSWSFLYRHVIRVLVDAGLRVVAPDLVGFGRSDKPSEVGDHSYARHIEWTRSLVFDALALRDVTLVGQDWGGLIGLRLAVAHPDRFARIVAANTGLPTGDFPMPETWLKFRQAVRTAPEFDVARNIQAGCRTPLRRRRPRGLRRAVPRRVVQGRAAGHAGARPGGARRSRGATEPRRLGRAAGVGQAVPRRVQRPGSDHQSDGRDLQGGDPRRPGHRAPDDRGAGHFLQEDDGVRLGEAVAAFVRAAE